MIPSTWPVAAALCVIAVLLWGSWASTFKAARDWRFELYYFDFVVGAMVSAVLTAFTLGEMGEGLTVVDNLSIAGKRQMAISFVAGGVFNLGNMLLMGALSLTGVASAFSIGFGIALLINVAWMLVTGAGGELNAYIGSALIILAVVQAFVVTGSQAAAGQKSGMIIGKSMGLALGAGILIGIAFPMLLLTMQGEIGLVPYSAGMLFVAGMLISTVVFNFYFMNLPISGKPISPVAYMRSSGAQHVLGILGGVLWFSGTLAMLVVAAAPAEAGFTPGGTLTLAYGGVTVAILWGLLVWKEITASGRQKFMALAMALLLAAGVTLIGTATPPASVSEAPAAMQ